MSVSLASTLPEFATFNQATKDFTIFTKDIDIEGTYSLAVEALITVPTDHTQESS